MNHEGLSFIHGFNRLNLTCSRVSCTGCYHGDVHCLKVSHRHYIERPKLSPTSCHTDWPCWCAGGCDMLHDTDQITGFLDVTTCYWINVNIHFYQDLPGTYWVRSDYSNHTLVSFRKRFPESFHEKITSFDLVTLLCLSHDTCLYLTCGYICLFSALFVRWWLNERALSFSFFFLQDPAWYIQYT